MITTQSKHSPKIPLQFYLVKILFSSCFKYLSMWYFAAAFCFWVGCIWVVVWGNACIIDFVWCFVPSLCRHHNNYSSQWLSNTAIIIYLLMVPSLSSVLAMRQISPPKWIYKDYNDSILLLSWNGSFHNMMKNCVGWLCHWVSVFQ